LADEPAAWHLIFGRKAFFGYNIDPTGGVVWFANVPRDQVTGPNASRRQLMRGRRCCSSYSRTTADRSG
jgi:hypothetical protein